MLKLVQLARADADLTVLSSKMKPQYFQGRVVWVTGASSGSKCGGVSADISYQIDNVPHSTRS